MPLSEVLGVAPSSEHTLCCRKKSNEDKYRFVLGTSNLTKKNNPNYLGKLTRHSENLFLVTLENGVHLAEIKFVQMLSKIAVSVQVLNQYINIREMGSKGCLFSYFILLTYLLYFSGMYVNTKISAPVLSLSVESTGRSVMELYNSDQFNIQNHLTESSKVTTPTVGHVDVEARYYVDFDYPFSIFLAFATLCAIEARQQV